MVGKLEKPNKNNKKYHHNKGRQICQKVEVAPFLDIDILLKFERNKISEYEIFLNLMQKKIGSNNHLNSLLQACCLKLNSQSIQEIENLMLRKLAIWDLKQNNKTTHSQYLTA
jgi:hypothetical protein